MNTTFQKFQDEEDLEFQVGQDNSDKQTDFQNQIQEIQGDGNSTSDSQCYLDGSHLQQSKMIGQQQWKNNNSGRQQLEHQEFDSLEGQDSDRDGSEAENSTRQDQRNENRVRNTDPTVSNALKQVVQRLEQPIKYLLWYQISLLVLKLSRIILVLGLLIKLFFEMTCQKSAIHSLLICAFLRDVISGILDLQLIFKVYEIRYKIRRDHIDEQVKLVGREIMRSKREQERNSQLVLGRFTQIETIHQIQQTASYEMFELETAINNLMPYIAHFMRILKYSYHFLFLISIIFIIRYDDEQFCHVFEKYTIIYLFLPIYFIFLVVAICLTFLGFFCTIFLVLLIILLGKYIHNKYKHQKQLQINELRANNLGFVRYSSIKHELNNNQCAVCLNNYLDDDSISILKCSNKHHFHHSCLKKWILLKGQCPSCRSEKII